MNFATDAMGRVLSGNTMTEQTDRTGAPATMQTTLDLGIQKTVEQAAGSIKNRRCGGAGCTDRRGARRV